MARYLRYALGAYVAPARRAEVIDNVDVTDAIALGADRPANARACAGGGRTAADGGALGSVWLAALAAAVYFAQLAQATEARGQRRYAQGAEAFGQRCVGVVGAQQVHAWSVRPARRCARCARRAVAELFGRALGAGAIVEAAERQARCTRRARSLPGSSRACAELVDLLHSPASRGSDSGPCRHQPPGRSTTTSASCPAAAAAGLQRRRPTPRRRWRTGPASRQALRCGGALAGAPLPWGRGARGAPGQHDDAVGVDLARQPLGLALGCGFRPSRPPASPASRRRTARWRAPAAGRRCAACSSGLHVEPHADLAPLWMAHGPARLSCSAPLASTPRAMPSLTPCCVVRTAWPASRSRRA